jgi:hypothetical protein
VADAKEVLAWPSCRRMDLLVVRLFCFVKIPKRWKGDTMSKAVLIVILTVGFLMTPFLIHAEVYQWIDNKGTIYFTDDYSNIPPSYREQHKVEIRRDIQEERAPLEPQKIIIRSKGEQAKTDLYRQDEAWWRGKERPWKQQLEEASENNKLANKELLGESSKLILRKFGSHQQFKSAILGLEKIREERSKHEARIIEAEGMLEKLSRGAKESKADLDWLISVLTPRQASSPDIRKIERDIYGRDEIWWRQKVFEVRGKLEDAVQNYEKSYEEYSKNVEKLGPFRFGGLSLTQYQMTSLRLNTLNDQMTKYQAQIAEAKEILEKLLKEAKETEADPAWLE